MRSIPLRYLLAFLCLLTAATGRSSHSQGIAAGGVQDVFGIDTVDAKTGNSYIQIPLVSLPQRGQVKSLDFVLSTNTTGWSANPPACSPAPFNSVPRCTYSYSETSTSQPVLSVPSFFRLTSTYQDLGTDAYTSKASVIYSMVDGTGATHQLFYDSSNPLELRSIDGSGYLARFQSGSQPYNRWTSSFPTVTIFDSSGRQSTTQADSFYNTIADVDGNTMISAPSGWTDTTGRLIASPASSTNLSQCPPPPAGGFAPTSMSLWSVPGYSQPFIFCYTTIHIHTSFWGNSGQTVTDNACDPDSGCTELDTWEETVEDEAVLQSVTRPDGSSWKFAYDSAPPNDTSTIAYGNLIRVVGPTGGAVSYCYELATVPSLSKKLTHGPAGILYGLLPYITYRVETQSDTPITCSQGVPTAPHWTYGNFVEAVSNTIYKVAETDPLGNDTVHYFPYQEADGGLDNPEVPNESDRYYYTGSFSSGTVAKHIAFHYTNQAGVPLHELPAGEETTVDGVLISSTSRSYPSTFTPVTYVCTFVFLANTNSCTSTIATSPVSIGIPTVSSAGGQQTTFQYEWQTDPSFLHANLMNAATSTTLSDATSSKTTEYVYDETGYVNSGLGLGHLTTVTQVNDHGSNWATHTHYGDYGMIDYTVDGRGNIPSSVSTWDSRHIFPTAVASPIGTVHFTHDPDTGNLLSSTDLNGNITSYVYDGYGRLQSIKNPDSPAGFTTYRCYPDPNTTVEYRAQLTALTSPTSCGAAFADATVTTTVVDGLGRLADATIGTGSAAVATSQQYDLLDRPFKQSNPYVKSAGPTLWTTSHYDSLGRVYQVDNQDGTPSYAIPQGLSKTLTDEAGHSRTIVSDSLGRVTQVLEPNKSSGALTMSTTYTYNVEGIIDIWQYGDTGDTPRHRQSAYDSLGRLLSSTNPETGTVSYSYTVNNALCAGDVSLPCSKTDARGVVSSYTYDALNRITQEQSAGGTGVAGFNYTFGYDAISPTPQPNLVGRLVWTNNNLNTNETYSYDAMGRVTGHRLGLPSNTSPPWLTTQVTAVYDLAGNITDLTYPDGRHVKQTWDGAGRLSSSALVDVGGVPQSQNYLTSATYNPDGSPNVLTLGNGVQQTITKNNRLQVQGLTVNAPSGTLGGATLLSHTYCYVGCTTGGTANNGNIWGITDTLKATNNQGYTYDSLNRISSFYLNGALNQKYDIDSFGNKSDEVGGVQVTTFDPATNRINNLPCAPYVNPSFDLAGNQLCSTDSNGAVSHYSYDANGDISQIALLGYESSPFVSYVYNPSGTRVRKNNANGAYTEYVDFGGQPMAEKDQTGAWTDYIYANGQKIAKVDTTSSVIHVHGNDCSTCSPGWVNSYFSSPIIGYQIQTGDTLMLMQKQTNIQGGFQLGTAQGGSTWPSVTDQNGDILNQSTAASGVWQTRKVILSGFAGQNVSMVMGTITTSPPANTVWDIVYGDIVIVSLDGTVHPIYTSGMQPSFSQSGVGGEADLAAYIDSIPNTVPGGTAVHYFLDDHLGTAQMELSAGGWPVWEGQFMPFGQEIVNAAPLLPGQPDGSSMHYKFTGKERDAESGLDYFGARYYGSAMGRFLSPDPSGLAFANVANPQSLNLYAYVRNNPLINTDPTGMECVWDDGSYDAQEDQDTGGVGQCQGKGGTWIELGRNGGWSASANGDYAANLRNLVSNLQQGQINEITARGTDGSVYVTTYGTPQNGQAMVAATDYSGQINVYGYSEKDPSSATVITSRPDTNSQMANALYIYNQLKNSAFPLLDPSNVNDRIQMLANQIDQNRKNTPCYVYNGVSDNNGIVGKISGLVGADNPIKYVSKMDPILKPLCAGITY